jgi:hypothetical protein
MACTETFLLWFYGYDTRSLVGGHQQFEAHIASKTEKIRRHNKLIHIFKIYFTTLSVFQTKQRQIVG